MGQLFRCRRLGRTRRRTCHGRIRPTNVPRVADVSGAEPRRCYFLAQFLRCYTHGWRSDAQTGGGISPPGRARRCRCLYLLCLEGLRERWNRRHILRVGKTLRPSLSVGRPAAGRTVRTRAAKRPLGHGSVAGAPLESRLPATEIWRRARRRNRGIAAHRPLRLDFGDIGGCYRARAQSRGGGSCG